MRFICTITPKSAENIFRYSVGCAEGARRQDSSRLNDGVNTMEESRQYTATVNIFCSTDTDHSFFQNTLSST
jgi:hypothetical protein